MNARREGCHFQRSPNQSDSDLESFTRAFPRSLRDGDELLSFAGNKREVNLRPKFADECGSAFPFIFLPAIVTHGTKLSANEGQNARENTTGMKICRPDNARGSFLGCGWHFSTATNGNPRAGGVGVPIYQRVIGRAIALAGILAARSEEILQTVARAN